MFSPTNKEFSNENKDKLVENWNRATLIFIFFFFSVFKCIFQSGSLKEPEPNKVPPQRPPPQGCLQYILDCNGVAVGPKQVQAT